ncbi:patatin-like phospholipase family protein [Paenibacillus sp. P36]|uniref:patatin-like phospholipase family protein n=1 Tax=Paenibacillus sp. P36 TaxID=3342538 RepID=UPI0038B2F0AC
MEQLSVSQLKAKEKLGLALSGGGFRASFFHLGVLARLAQLGVLRHVKVISTVSGGSIIGALFYQELLKEISSKEGKLSNTDYIKVVQCVEEKFVLAVDKNIRGKLFLNPWYETLSLCKGREKVLSNFYNKYFYNSDMEMTQLQDSYGIAPNLIINATSLNNGQHWFFSPHQMGQYEVSGSNSKGIIGYEYNRVKLSDAVAASSAVPGLFNYVNFECLDNIKLVDGGVFDNLGIYALQQEKVDFMIISDASRPLLLDDHVPRRRLSVLKRGFDASLVFCRKLLLDKIPANEKLYISIEDNVEELPKALSDNLSRIRTDLDNFHRFESKTLCFFGYHVTAKYFKSCPSLDKKSYIFQDIENEVTKVEDEYLLRVLKSGSTLSRTDGNLLFRTKGWLAKIEGLIELWRDFFISIITFAIGLIYLFNFALIQGMVKSKFRVENETILSIGLIIFLISYILLFIFIVRKSLGDSFSRKADSILLKILHGLGVFLLWLTILFAVFFVIGVGSYTLSHSPIVFIFSVLIIVALLVFGINFKKRTSYHWPRKSKRG